MPAYSVSMSSGCLALQLAGLVTGLTTDTPALLQRRACTGTGEKGASLSTGPATSDVRKILVGGYPTEDSNATYAILDFDPAARNLSIQAYANTTGDASKQKAWTSRHPTNSSIVLACNDLCNGIPDPGLMSSYALNAETSELTFIASVDSGGAPERLEKGVCAAHCTFIHDGKTAAVANYYGATAATYEFDPSTGQFGKRLNAELLNYQSYVPQPGQREAQDFSHPHQVVQHPSLPVVYIMDHGADLIRSYNLKEDGTLESLKDFKQPVGSTPRHMAITPDGKYAYVANELAVNIQSFAIDDKTGELTEVGGPLPIYPASVTLGANNSAAEIFTSNDGKFLYASSRNATERDLATANDRPDFLAVYSIASADGALTRLEDSEAYIANTGQIRSFEMSPPRSQIAVVGQPPLEEYFVVGGQMTNNVVVLRRDMEKGTLEEIARVDLPDLSPTTFLWLN